MTKREENIMEEMFMEHDRIIKELKGEVKDNSKKLQVDHKKVIREFNKRIARDVAGLAECNDFDLEMPSYSLDHVRDIVNDEVKVMQELHRQWAYSDSSEERDNQELCELLIMYAKDEWVW